MTQASGSKVALFIDADNAPAKAIDAILTELAKYGSLAIRRAYGNWKNDNLKSWEALLFEKAIQPIQQYDITKGKNATDMAMTIDVMDIMHHGTIDTFCLVSSDCDFAPLATRIRAQGNTVIGFGERKTPPAFANVCNSFSYIDDEEAQNNESQATGPIDGRTLKSDTTLMNLLRGAVETSENDEGWALLSTVGAHISNHTSFNVRNYGYKRLKDLFEAIDIFDITVADGGHTLVKDKRKTNSKK